MSKLEYAVSEWPGDFSCPHCQAPLCYEEDRWYMFNTHKVRCKSCDKPLTVKGIQTTEYIVNKAEEEKK
jgi:hypothetical protein